MSDASVSRTRDERAEGQGNSPAPVYCTPGAEGAVAWRQHPGSVVRLHNTMPVAWMEHICFIIQQVDTCGMDMETDHSTADGLESGWPQGVKQAEEEGAQGQAPFSTRLTCRARDRQNPMRAHGVDWRGGGACSSSCMPSRGATQEHQVQHRSWLPTWPRPGGSGSGNGASGCPTSSSSCCMTMVDIKGRWANEPACK